MDTQALDRMIADLDKRIACQLAEIQEHPALRELWRLVEEVAPDARTTIALFNCRFEDIEQLGSKRCSSA